MPRECYQLDDLTLDIEAASLERGGKRLELPKLSFDLLVALVRQAPAVVSSDELVSSVWQGVAVSNETLTQRVALLRRALGDDAQNPRYVRALRGRGYQLIPRVTPLAEARAERLAPANPRRLPHRQLAGLILALLLGLGVWTLTRHSVAPAAPPLTQPAGARELSERAGAYLERHQEADNETAIELYRRALQLEPQRVTALAGLSLALSQRATKFNRAPEPEAETLARRALALEPRSGRALHALALALDSQGRLSEALAAYRKAAELDDAPAPVLASAAHLLQVSGRLAEALEWNLRAAEARGPAPIYLEVQLGRTLHLLGFAEAAEVWFERGLALKPDNVFAAAAFAETRLAQGRATEADALAAAALARGIRRPELFHVRALAALLAGRSAAALGYLDEALALDPQDFSSRVRRLCAAPGADDLAALAAEADAALAEGDNWPSLAYDRMLLAVAAGEKTEAIAAFDLAVELGFRDEGLLRVDPMLSGLRSEAGFAQRLGRLRQLVEAERQRVLGAPWLPAGFLSAASR